MQEGGGKMIETFSLYIQAFQEKRKVSVHLPEDYEHCEKRYPVLYMHDGQNVFRDNEAVGGVSLALEQYLDRAPQNVIVVGIDQNGRERSQEYCPWTNGAYSKRILGDTASFGGKGAQYADFVVNKLKPHIDGNYRTIKNESSIAGISLGGLITAYICCRYPDVFHRITMISPAFYANQEKIEALLRDADLSGIQSIYIDYGTREAGNDPLLNNEFIQSVQAVADIAAAKHPHVTCRRIDGGEHHYSHFRKRISALFNHS